MIVRIATVFLSGWFIFFLPFLNAQMDNIDRVLFYCKGRSKQITDPTDVQRVIEEAISLFAHADDIYVKPISNKDIDEFRKKYCVEIIFTQPREIVILAIRETKIISKILIPLDESMCASHAHILFGDPDYKTFNMLLKSKGCLNLKRIIRDW